MRYTRVVCDSCSKAIDIHDWIHKQNWWRITSIHRAEQPLGWFKLYAAKAIGSTPKELDICEECASKVNFLSKRS